MSLSKGDMEFIKEKIPPPYNSLKRYEEFILPKIQMHGVLCTTAISTVNRVVAPMIEKYQHRFFCRLDNSHPLKSPSSIIDKIRRSQNEASRNPNKEAYDIDNFERKMTDIARFRIVCNFLNDAKQIADFLKTNEELNRYFNFIEIKFSIDQHPDKRSSGERSIKFILEHKSHVGLFLEIQIMTQLEEAWDKKDHFLVYEKRRRNPEKGEDNFLDFLDAKMFAMAELLYVADQYFEQLRSSEEEDGL